MDTETNNWNCEKCGKKVNPSEEHICGKQTQPDDFTNKVLDKKWTERFYALYRDGRKNHKAPQDYIDYFKAREFLSNEITQAKQQTREEFKEEIKNNIGFLRQWLNEKPTDRLVKNEDIEKWLFK